MQKKSRRLNPLQLFVIAAILIATAVYRLMGPPTGANLAPGPAASGTHASAAPQSAPDTRESAPSFQEDTPRPTAIANTPFQTTDNNSVPTAYPMKAFDYFVLSLSWSPDYCAANGSQDPQQCAIGKKLGFVLHGLWPQNMVGYPSSCSTEKLTAAVKSQFSGLYPNESLLDHEWEKHGTCTGLPPQQYLQLTRQLKQSVTIPDNFISPQSPFRTTSSKLIDAFSAANPDLPGTSLAVNCSDSGRYLSELYVCFSRDGQPGPCSTEVNKKAVISCNNGDFLVKNTR